MRKFSQLLFCILIPVYLNAQDLKSELALRIEKSGENIPADQLFLQLDRNLYRPGDTVRFQGYIRDSRTGIFGTESTSLFVLLINSQRETIDSARFRINSPVVSGWLAVPESSPSGGYSVLAFTSTDMNFSPAYIFSAPIKIERFSAKGNPQKKVVKTPDSPISEKPSQNSRIDLGFFPEGGTFIYGIKQRIAFYAKKSNGRGAEVKGEILNQNGEKICDLRSSSYGSGIFEFTPLNGDYYIASLEGNEYSGMKFHLPNPEPEGVSLRVNNTGDGLTDIILRGRKIEGISYLLSLTMNNVLVFAEDVRMDTIYKKKLQTDKLPSGIAYISLYDNNLTLIAERLILINNYKRLNIKIETSSSFANPDEEAELTLSTFDEKGDRISSVLSVAIIDSASGCFNSIVPSQIEDTYLYDRSFYENLPLQIKSIGLRNFDLGSIDVLLMAFGHRNYHSQKDTESPEQEFVNYDCIKIQNEGLPLTGRSAVNMITDAGPDVISLKVSNKGEAILNLDSLDPNVRQIMLMPENISSKIINSVTFEFPSNKEFIDKAKLLANFPSNPANDFPVIVEGEEGSSDDDNFIPEPGVNNSAPGETESKEDSDYHSGMYQSTGAITVYGKDFSPSSTLEDIIYRSNPNKIVTTSISAGTTGKLVYLRNAPNSIKGHGSSDDGIQPALIVLDNNQIGITYESIADMPASRIASVTFLRGTQGFTLYGTRAIGGVVFITTKFGNEFKKDRLSTVARENRNDNLFKQVRLFRTENEFYIPPKREAAPDQKHLIQSTLLWKDHVVTEDSGKITIKYPNNLRSRTAIIVVNGISISNLIGSQTYTYEIQ